MKISMIALALSLILCSCCTLSLTNISTHGTATDVIDQEQKQDGTADLDATIPLM